MRNGKLHALSQVTGSIATAGMTERLAAAVETRQQTRRIAMSSKCAKCGAPVNLAPDGDPRYEPPTYIRARLTDTERQLHEAQSRADKAEAEVARLRNTFTRLRAEKLEYWMERCERLEAESNQRLQLLQAAKCPACDGSGAIPHGPTLDGDWELEECQWCHERNAELTPEPDEKKGGA